MTDTRYYVVDRMAEPILLRRVGHADSKFLDGTWQPTLVIIDYEFGHNDHVDDITETEARKIAPAAFDRSNA